MATCILHESNPPASFCCLQKPNLHECKSAQELLHQLISCTASVSAAIRSWHMLRVRVNGGLCVNLSSKSTIFHDPLDILTRRHRPKHANAKLRMALELSLKLRGRSCLGQTQDASTLQDVFDCGRQRTCVAEDRGESQNNNP